MTHDKPPPKMGMPMPPKSLNRHPHGMAELLTQHLGYEFDMLRCTQALLQSGVRDPCIANALIEPFSLHARSLIDFFLETGPPTGKEAAARHFTDQSYKPFQGENSRKPKLYGKLNEQVAHLSYGRTSKAEDKIGPADREHLTKLISEEMANFRAHLKDSYRSAEIGFPDILAPGPTQAVATNAVTAISWTGPATTTR